ncbi:MAG: Ig-like domain repeat protein, partial [Verrucomicrobia bacterium]|nr:Ig-like domain repeat protein [Verrucomicrobiota bacterium]
DGTAAAAAAAAILTIGNNLDGVNLTLTGSGALASWDVGLQAISAGTLALGGSAASNYTLTGLSGSVTITAASSTTALASSLNPAPTGTNVMFTATVSAVPPGAGTPTNQVQFRTNGVPAALVGLNASAQAVYATSWLPHGSNAITAEYVSDGNFLASTNSLLQVVNTAPVANPFSLGAVSGLPATLPVIGSTNVADADGDPLTVTAVSAPAHGIAGTDGTHTTYTATNNFVGTDSFNFTVSDNYGDAATNTVTVSVIANSAGLNRLTAGLSSGNVVLTYLGIPWNNYALEQTLSLSPRVWLPVVTTLAPANGYLMFTNPPQPGANSFWRTRLVP